MIATAMEGGHLHALVRMILPVVQAAEPPNQRRRGAPVSYTQWQMAAMVLVGILSRRKSKSAQYRYLTERCADLMALLKLVQWPSRSTYF